MGYRNQIDRAALTVSEGMLLCNIITLNQAYDNETYVYDFSEYPGLHGSDIAFTFYDPEQPTRRTSLVSFGPPNVTLADVIQDYITSFAMDGRPQTKIEGVPKFEITGENSFKMLVNSSGILPGTQSQGSIDRCRFWQMGYQY